MELIDTHCHLDRYAQEGTINSYIKNALEHHVRKMIAIGTHPNDWNVHQKLQGLFPETIYYTVGLHPCYVDEASIGAIDQIYDFFDTEHPPVALGECGLDYYHLDKDSTVASRQKKLQISAFVRQLEMAVDLKCPLVIHSRYAIEECILLLQDSKVEPSKVIFHCFSEGVDQIRLILDAGYQASFTGIITYKNAQSVRQAALYQGLDRLILETDAPYLAPMPKRGEPNQPAYTYYIAEYCAKLWNVALEDIATITTHNARAFFGI